MSNLRLIIYLLVAGLIFIAGCKPNVQVDSNQHEKEKQISKELMQVNHYMVKRNQEHIRNFVRRTGWNMKETGTGLWYKITRHGDGPAVRDGDVVVLSFKARLLNGEVVDSASVQHPRSFVVGHGGVEAGIEEAVLLLHGGDEARLILPPHLAHGNFGDAAKIPPGAILLFDIHVLAIK